MYIKKILSIFIFSCIFNVYGNIETSIENNEQTDASKIICKEEVDGNIWSYIVDSNNNAVIVRGEQFAGKVVIPNTLGGKQVVKIQDRAFSWQKELTHIQIPEGVTHIGDGAFSYCHLLRTIEIPDSVTYMGESVFYDCRIW